MRNAVDYCGKPSVAQSIAAVLGAGGALWYFKFRKDGKKSGKAPIMDEFDFEDEDFEDESEDEPEDEPEDG